MPTKIPIERLMELVESDENIGVCTNCSNEQEGVEPDAREYCCMKCGHNTVFGAEQLLIEGSP